MWLAGGSGTPGRRAEDVCTAGESNSDDINKVYQEALAVVFKKWK